MRRLFGCELSVLLLAAMAAGAQVDKPTQSGQPPVSPSGQSVTPPDASETPTTPGILVTAPRIEQPLPALPPDEFTDCAAQNAGANDGTGSLDLIGMAMCQHQLNAEKRIVVEACVNPKGNTAPARVIQACTELLDRGIFERYQRYAVYLNRAAAYFVQGDKQRALGDYDEAAKLSPHKAVVYYYRGLFYWAQSDGDAALRDFDTAIGMNAKFIPALRQRAKLKQSKGDFNGALTDYSEAIRLQPKAAALWSERGYVRLRQRDNDGALKDEAQAIQLDPKLALAYFFRGVALVGLGDSSNAVTDLKNAVDLDPSLDRYVTSKGKSASLRLPPLP